MENENDFEYTSSYVLHLYTYFIFCIHMVREDLYCFTFTEHIHMSKEKDDHDFWR